MKRNANGRKISGQGKEVSELLNYAADPERGNTVRMRIDFEDTDSESDDEVIIPSQPSKRLRMEQKLVELKEWMGEKFEETAGRAQVDELGAAVSKNSAGVAKNASEISLIKEKLCDIEKKMGTGGRRTT